jgi:hypothetical protein
MSRQEIVLPLNELEIKGGQFVAPDSVSTEQQLKTRPQYDAAEYEVQSDDQQIERSEFAAFESGDVSDQPGGSGSLASKRRAPSLLHRLPIKIEVPGGRRPRSSVRRDGIEQSGPWGLDGRFDQLAAISQRAQAARCAPGYTDFSRLLGQVDFRR